MNYRIIGNDGKNYGPVSAEQIRVWIAQNRVESRTPVFVDGAADWTFVGLLPEFAAQFQSPPPMASLKPNAPPAKPNSFATAGLVCGILAVTLFCCCGGFPFNLLGLIFSIIALAQIAEHPVRSEGRVLAIIGLILSIISFLFLLIELACSHSHIAFNTGQFQ